MGREGEFTLEDPVAESGAALSERNQRKAPFFFGALRCHCQVGENKVSDHGVGVKSIEIGLERECVRASREERRDSVCVGCC